MSSNEEKIQSGLTNEELINKAITFHQAGNFEKAELYYQQILKNFPKILPSDNPPLPFGGAANPGPWIIHGPGPRAVAPPPPLSG